jgi:uncharacterized protein YjbK
MRMHLEIEVKWALTGAEHARLGSRLPRLLGPPWRLAQDNRFYDSADGRLRRAGLACRLRREGAAAVLTCKGRAATAPAPAGTSVHEEHERHLSLGDAAALERDPAALAALLPPAWSAALAGAPLRFVGGFANQRRQWWDGLTLVCLDRTAFPGRIDCEIEFEGSEPAAAAERWRRHFSAWRIGVRPQPISKAARLRELLRRG